MGAETRLIEDVTANAIREADGTGGWLHEARVVLAALRDAGWSVVKLRSAGYKDRRPVYRVSEGSPLPENPSE